MTDDGGEFKGAFRAAFKRQKVGDILGPSKFDDEFEKATTVSGGTRTSIHAADPPEAVQVEGLLSNLVATLDKLGEEAGLVTTVKAKSRDRGPLTLYSNREKLGRYERVATRSRLRTGWWSGLMESTRFL